MRFPALFLYFSRFIYPSLVEIPGQFFISLFLLLIYLNLLDYCCCHSSTTMGVVAVACGLYIIFSLEQYKLCNCPSLGRPLWIVAFVIFCVVFGGLFSQRFLYTYLCPLMGLRMLPFLPFFYIPSLCPLFSLICFAFLLLFFIYLIIALHRNTEKRESFGELTYWGDGITVEVEPAKEGIGRSCMPMLRVVTGASAYKFVGWIG